MIEDCAFSQYRLCYNFKENVDPEGHPNGNTGSKFMAILLNGGILSTCGLASKMVCAQPAKQACLIV